MWSGEQTSQGALGVFSSDHLPMSQPNPTLLSQLLPHIPPMVASLLKEDSNSGTSCLEQLAELVHCMVFRFPGFPDLYEPVMEAIKVSDSPRRLPRPTLTRVSIGALLRAMPQIGEPPSIIWSLAIFITSPGPSCASGTLSQPPFPARLILSHAALSFCTCHSL